MKDTIRLCKTHGMTEFRDIGRGDSKRGRCIKCRSEAVQRRRDKLKQMAVDYKGGRCQHCGYDRCIQALEFHHIDPTCKDFAISSGNTVAFEKIKVELDKCILLCANCHREEHVRLRV